MMQEYLLQSAFGLYLRLFLPLLLAALAGGVLAGTVQALFRIEDRIIGFAGRFGGVVLGVFLFARYHSSTLQEFAVRVWGSSDLAR